MSDRAFVDEVPSPEIVSPGAQTLILGGGNQAFTLDIPELSLQLGPIADAVFGCATAGADEVSQLQRQLRLLALVNIVPASPYRVTNTAGMRESPPSHPWGLPSQAVALKP